MRSACSTARRSFRLLRLQVLEDRPVGLRRGRVPAQVRRAQAVGRARGQRPILTPRPRLRQPSPWRSISAAERNIARGFAAPVPAMSGAEPWTGSNRPGVPGSPSEALGQHPDRAGDHRGLVGEDVAEHVLGDDHVEVARGARRAASPRCRRARARARMSGNSSAWTRSTVSRHSRERLEHVGLVDRGDLAPCARAEGDAGDALDLLDRVAAQVAGARRGVAGLLAEVDAAGQLADDQQVGALDALALERAGVEQRGHRRGPGAGWRTGRGPCAGRAGPARAAAAPGRSCPTSARRRRRAGRRRRRGRRRATSSVSAVPWASIDAPPKGCSVNVKSPRRPQDLERRGGDLGPDPVAGQDGDGVAMGSVRLAISRLETSW